MHKRIVRALLALALFGGVSGLVAACPGQQPQCAAGTVAERDDDGWECEPDRINGELQPTPNGIDDEQDVENFEGND